MTIRWASADTSLRAADPAGPTRGKAEAIGSPNHGCLAGGIGLPLKGPGYQVSRPERRRYFGHPALVDFIEALARRAQAAGLPLLYVGDMGQPRGGPLPDSAHHSHQSGLDADFWFTFGPHYTPDLTPRALPDPRSMVQSGKGGVDARRFGQDQMTLLRFALADPRVDRILVDPAIKLALCHGAAGAVYFGMAGCAALSLAGHHDHFHVRLRCPESSPSCVPSDRSPGEHAGPRHRQHLRGGIPTPSWRSGWQPPAGACWGARRGRPDLPTSRRAAPRSRPI